MKKREVTETIMSAFLERLAYEESFPLFVNNEDPLRFTAPKANGLYLIGNTLFNPISDEKFYLIKVGTSKNLQSRMKNYKTQNPLLFHIDYYEFTGENDLLERECHRILLENCTSRLENVEEWFRVSKEDYFTICEQGFKYFFNKKKELTPLAFYDII